MSAAAEAAVIAVSPAEALPVSGAALAAEVEAWLARTGTSRTAFGLACANSPTMVQRMHAAAFPRPETVALARAFIAAYPDGLGPAGPHGKGERAASRAQAAAEKQRPPARIAADVRAEAEGPRRRMARSSGTVASPIPPSSLTERIQGEMAATPRDLIKAVYRRHPGLWRRCVLIGRAAEATPATVLYDALDRGLGAIERETLPGGGA